MQAQFLLLPLLTFLALAVEASPGPDPLEGQAEATIQAATQMATTTIAGSLFTVDGTTSATWVLFTQTFAATALGTWDLGTTPKVGTIGFGSIAGTVGGEVWRRAMPTPELGSG